MEPLKPMRGDKCWIYNINPDLHPTSKEVIDLSNGKIYGSLKSACLDLKIKYSSMLSKISLNGKGKNVCQKMNFFKLLKVILTCIISDYNLCMQYATFKK